MRRLTGVVLACALAACGSQTASPATPATPSPTTTTVTTGEPEPGPEPVVACAPVEEPPLQSGSHLIGDQDPPVPYSSIPPTSGWHASGAFTIGVQPPELPLSEPQQVSVLEAGGVVVTYGDLADEDRASLEAHVGDHHDGRVAVTAYPALAAGEVAFTAWATLQRCERLDLAALDAFVDAHAVEEPGVPGTH